MPGPPPRSPPPTRYKARLRRSLQHSTAGQGGVTAACRSPLSPPRGADELLDARVPSSQHVPGLGRAPHRLPGEVRRCWEGLAAKNAPIQNWTSLCWWWGRERGAGLQETPREVIRGGCIPSAPLEGEQEGEEAGQGCTDTPGSLRLCSELAAAGGFLSTRSNSLSDTSLLPQGPTLPA